MKKMNNKAQASGIIGGVISLVMLVVGVVIVQSVLNDTTFISGLATTISQYIVPVAILGGLVTAGMLAARGMKRR